MKHHTPKDYNMLTLLAVCCAAFPLQGALRFDGTNDFVTFGPAPGLGVTNFTIECWFKRQGDGVTASTGSGGFSALPLVTKGRGENEAGVTNMNFFLGLATSNRLAADFEDRNNGLNHPVINVNPAASSNTWQHAAVTYNVASSNWVVYLNGLPVATNIVSGATAVRTPEGNSIQHAALGTALNTTGATEGFFKGSLEEVRVWNATRNANQVLTNINRRITSAAGLVGRWPLTETSGTNASDTSGSGITGTLINGPAWTADTAFSETFVVGNTNDGIVTDTLWAGGAFINASRFQANTNMALTTIYARVTAIAGRYKCAVYTDSNSLPRQLLGSTTEVNNPADGWQTFPLTSSVTLTNGQFCWLAIWSDDSDAQAYYTDSTGTLRWGQYNYSASWPNPIVAPVGNDLRYCIYASGTTVPTLSSITVTPANPTISPGNTQQFTATGNYSDGSAQNLTSQVSWVSSNTPVATINSSGLATGVSTGTATISATLGSISGNTLLTVQAPSLSVTTTSLPNAVISVPYSATLTASGGTPPYTWQLLTGSLPSGLSLNTNSGAITGTPTAIGNSSFTARVRDNVNATNTSGTLNINVTSGLPPGTNVILTFSNAWRYMQVSNLDGTTWKQPSFNDSAWPSGQGVLALEDCNCLPEQIRTTLTLFTNRLTHYFRTHFTFSGSTSGASLLFSNLVDNGAVLYLNGVEIQRIRMPAGTITDSTPASEGVDNTTYDVFTISGTLLTNLVQGDNVIAVEVHQADFESTDVVFGCSISSITDGTSPGTGGLRFDGVNDMVTMGIAPGLGLSNFTIECWFRPQGTGKRANTGTGGIFAQPLVTKGMAEDEVASNNMNYFFGIGTNNVGQPVLAADFEDFNTGLNHPIRGTGLITSNVWQHGAVTYNVASSNWVLYLNGSQDATFTITATNALMVLPRFDSIQHAALGSSLRTSGNTNADSGFFAGTLDEVRIWNVTRTSQQISNSYNVQITTNAPGLIARWALDDAAGTAATNSIPGAVNGTLTNGPVWADGYPFPVPVNLPPSLAASNSPSNGATNVSLSPTLNVTASDPEGGNLTVTYYGRVAQASAAPGRDFTLIAMPDTQHYSAGINGGLPAMFTNQTHWIVNQRTNLNIQYVAQLGDCVQNGDNGGNNSQWLVATSALYRLENPITTELPEGVPYGVAVGNHDQGSTGNGDPNGSTVFYNQYFGTNHFQNYAYYGSHYGTNNDNHYDLFSASGLDFIVLYFEYDSSMTTNSPVLAWANSVLQTNRNRRAIGVSHHIINAGFNATFSTQGSAIYNGLKGNTNLFLLLSGHVTPPEGQRTNVFEGRTVWSVMTDYQDRAGGGNGWLRLYEFSPSNNVIRARTYSPWLDQSETDIDSQFDIPYSMTSLTPFTALGTNGNVPSDSGSLLIWTNLASNTQYEWYVSVSDGVNTTNSPVWTFTTGTGAPQPPAITDEPDSQTVQCGNNALLSVVVTSETTPDYQWYFGATPLADKTNATLSLLAAGESDEGTYKVVVHNLGGSVTSAPAVITIIDTNPPTVAGYPTNTTIGANASCQASIPDLASQVVADDACSGVAVTQLPLAGSVVGLGAYPVILTIKDAANNQTTRNALVTVVDGVVPLITSQPQSSTNIAGSTGGFAVSASSCTPLAYQWRIGDSAIPSETGSALTITNVQPGNGGGYSVVLSNAAGYSTSIVATLTVISPAMPGLFIQPTLLPNGHFYAGFTGTPNLPYTIKYATDVTGPWQTLTNITSDGIGLIPIDDIPAPAPSSRFYRVVYP